ncbi:hypothetical protein ACQE3E_01465 [Methylomonas sp. MED-D]|uniref:hypothetical protein n=1 Tax=unclassified Methylomonas TaxID=2608980 RepID=UPI0028A4E9B3|nr:hypothetical protein [Methylomonas sp. MV1]MDT4330422.1 hypothetical protein [Methylomonas sp. MV1]
MKAMQGMKKDILIGTLFFAGIWNFMSGLFLVSTVLFAATSMFSNMSKAQSNG